MTDRLSRVCKTEITAGWTSGASPYYPPCHYCGQPVYPGQGSISWLITLRARAVAHLEKRP